MNSTELKSYYWEWLLVLVIVTDVSTPLTVVIFRVKGHSSLPWVFTRLWRWPPSVTTTNTNSPSQDYTKLDDLQLPQTSKVFISILVRLNLQQAIEALKICFQVFTNDSEYRPLTRRAVIKVCLVLLRATSTSVIREFYVEHIKKIMEIVETRFFKVFRIC